MIYIFDLYLFEKRSSALELNNEQSTVVDGRVYFRMTTFQKILNYNYISQFIFRKYQIVNTSVLLQYFY